MNIIYFDNIPFQLDASDVGEQLKLRNRESLMEILEEQIELAQKVAVPKAAYFETSITDKSEDSVAFCGETFHSRQLAISTQKDQKIFPYIITIGMELEEQYQELDDIMEQYIMDGVQSVILTQATDYVAKALKESFQLKEVTYHIPGALDDWDLKDQPKLFHLFGSTMEKLGVVLSHSNLMKPTKSVSGVYYGIEVV